jgi:hypothetical protein
MARTYGYILKLVKEQTPEICLEAIKRDYWAIEFVREQTPEICVAALAETEESLEHVKISLEMSLKQFLDMLS